MCKVMCDPLGQSEKPSQILQATFQFWKVSEISTTQTYKGIQLYATKPSL